MRLVRVALITRFRHICTASRAHSRNGQGTTRVSSHEGDAPLHATLPRCGVGLCIAALHEDADCQQCALAPASIAAHLDDPTVAAGRVGC